MDAQQFLMMAAKQGCPWNIDALSVLAIRSGLRLSADDLITAAEEMWGNLSEDQLRGVAGGNGRSNPGEPVDPSGNPPPGHTRDSDTFSPRAGDVSGNSCFFIRPR